MKIEAVFSSEVKGGYPICVDTFGLMGYKYATYKSEYMSGYKPEHIMLFLKEMPDFEKVFDIFLNTTYILFNQKTLDICLSLFYKPYFNEFCDKVKQCSNQISAVKKKYLIKHMLGYLGDDIQYGILVQFANMGSFW